MKEYMSLIHVSVPYGAQAAVYYFNKEYGIFKKKF